MLDRFDHFACILDACGTGGSMCKSVSSILRCKVAVWFRRVDGAVAGVHAKAMYGWHTLLLKHFVRQNNT